MNIGVLREVALLPVLVLLLVVGAVVSPAFLTVSNIAGIGQQISALGVVVVGESLILMIGGMDLSLESTYGLAPMVAAWLILPISAFGSGAAAQPVPRHAWSCSRSARQSGLVNGLLIVKGRLNGFIVTLGMTIVLAGLQNGIVKAQTLFNLPTAFGYLGVGLLGPGAGVASSSRRSSSCWSACSCAITGPAGPSTRSAATRPRPARPASRSSGSRSACYVAGSMLAALGGLMEAGRVSAVTGQQGYGEGIIFSVFAAAVIGGVSLRGGRGNMIGAASGVILLGLVQDILDLANVSNYWIEAIDGGVILFALFLARIVGGESTRRGEVGR